MKGRLEQMVCAIQKVPPYLHEVVLAGKQRQFREENTCIITKYYMPRLMRAQYCLESSVLTREEKQ